MNDIIWAKGPVSPGQSVFVCKDETYLDSHVAVISRDIDWIKIPKNKNMGKWSGREARVLSTEIHRCVLPTEDTHNAKWHRLDGPFWCIECAVCSKWSIVEKDEGIKWLQSLRQNT